MLFKKRIKELREDQKLSQLQLSRELGISQSAIAKWELGKTEPSACAIVGLCKFFDVSADYILGLENDDGSKNLVES